MKLHKRENLPENEAHLNANRRKFSNQCKVIMEVFLRGERLTTLRAITKYGIGDLRRRIKDLKDFNGVDISETWEMDKDGKTTRNKVWFLSPKTSTEKKELQKWLNDFQEEKPTLPPTPLQLF